jgi:pyrroloquinoline quinone biosynthesis protein D
MADQIRESQPHFIDPTTRLRLSSKTRVQIDKITGKLTLLYPEGVLLLNPTGAAIVELCDGHHTVGEIVSNLAARYDLTPERLSVDIAEYLERLRERGLVELSQDKDLSS